MPLNRPPLLPAEIDMLARWIDQGAKHPTVEPAGSLSATPGTHWAFIPSRRVSPPATLHPEWSRNPIDAFILARLDRRARASEPPDQATILRRVSLDLIGLPPSPTEIAEFLGDREPGAYERLVDRLLSSPDFGVRWAHPWLDAARYADSNGYSIDGPRSIWKYRDWVVDALNADYPFDQFTIDQIAGDLRPGATVAGQVATGFQRSTPINEEGGIDREQFRVDSVIDRVNTAGSVFLGLTIGCAQCHDHKFDPISQREYYRLFAFFNNVDEPTLTVSTPEFDADARKPGDGSIRSLPTFPPGSPVCWRSNGRGRPRCRPPSRRGSPRRSRRRSTRRRNSEQAARSTCSTSCYWTTAGIPRSKPSTTGWLLFNQKFPGRSGRWLCVSAPGTDEEVMSCWAATSHEKGRRSRRACLPCFLVSRRTRRRRPEAR